MPVAVAAPHPAAVEAARRIAEAGGNAFDAALAAAGALTVVYPHQCSAGGDLVAIVRPAGGPARAVLSIGAAAAAVDVAALRATGDRMPFDGPQTITVPGVVAGWAAIAEFGRLPLSDLLAPAIGLAKNGVPVSPGLLRAITGQIDRIRADPGLTALLLDDAGEPRTALIQPVLAETLADWETFYRGPLAHRLAAGLRALGNPIDVRDLAAHEAEVTDPLIGVRNGVTWFAAPPPVQGATFLAIVGSDDLLADALRARAARDALLGDPRTGPVDLDGLLLRAPAPADARPDAGPQPGGDTVAVTAVDADGNAITLIQSVFESFGSGRLDPGTGLVLHNRGSSFRLDPDHPGRLAPGARPPHTLCPAIAVGDDLVLALGCQGGRNQPWILAQTAAGALAAADDELAAVVTRPRWVLDGAGTLLIEPGVEVRTELPINTSAGPHDGAGHVQVARLRGRDLAAASDPRADGLGTIVG